MSLSGAHKAAFRREAPLESLVFSLRDEAGYPIARDDDGHRALPFWSKSSRAERVIGQVAVFEGFNVVAIPLEDWLGRWLPRLGRSGILIGINWAGRRATGFDLPAPQVLSWMSKLP
jgi:hypothetical protein